MTIFKSFSFLVIVLFFYKEINALTDFELNLIKKREETLGWCTIGAEEYRKCEVMRNITEGRDAQYFGTDLLHIKCVNGTSKEDCMHMIEQDKADITSVDAGELFIGGRYFSIIPIMQHLYPGSVRNFYAVAVIKKNTLPHVRRLSDLKGVKACFTGVGRLAGWVIPIATLMSRGGLKIDDCNNHVKNAINYFGDSCAVNSLKEEYNPTGDNSHKLCNLCAGKVAGTKCTNADPYAGFTGAFRCLIEVGEIAFLKHTTITEIISNNSDFPSISTEDFELLCLDGSRKSIDQYASCNWGFVPSPAIVTTSEKSNQMRKRYQRFLQSLVLKYGPEGQENQRTYQREDFSNRDNFNNRDNSNRNREDVNKNDFNRNWDDFRRNKADENNRNRYDQNRKFDLENRYDNRNDEDNLNRDRYNNRDEKNNTGRNFNQYGYSTSEAPDIYYNQPFNLFNSVPRFGKVHNLLVEDAAVKLAPLEERHQTYTSYLEDKLDIILKIRGCPVNAMTLCVTSDPEMEKCAKMKTALRAQLLKPEMTCYKGHSHIHCMQAIKNGDADVAVLDAGDIYTAGLQYDLIPIISEVYNLQDPEYYVVAVAKEEDADTEITYLKGKNTCHGGINSGAGWVIPMAYMLSNGWIRPYGCNAMRAAAEYFSKSCVPGAISTEYNTGVPYDNMCHLCHGSSYTYCRRDASEDYYGHTGAFRCLVEGGGHVAFVKHTTVMENTDGKRKEWWARNTLNEDYQLLCPDGTRNSIDKYKECSLGRVKSNAIVTRGGEGYNATEVNAFINLFIYAQQFYGRNDPNDFLFAMFYSQPPYADLIFQDATTQLRVIDPKKRWYSDYLGKDFMRAKRVVDCYAASNIILPSQLLIFSVIIYLNL